jgi:hypothetical protein
MFGTVPCNFVRFGTVLLPFGTVPNEDIQCRTKTCTVPNEDLYSAEHKPVCTEQCRTAQDSDTQCRTAQTVTSTVPNIDKYSAEHRVSPSNRRPACRNFAAQCRTHPSTVPNRTNCDHYSAEQRPIQCRTPTFNRNWSAACHAMRRKSGEALGTVPDIGFLSEIRCSALYCVDVRHCI